MSKKLSFFAVGTLIIGSSAFAQTYSCDVLKDTHGHALLGSPGYAIEVEGQNVTLEVITGADEGQPVKTTDYRMELVSRQVEAAIYEAQGVNATLVTGITGIPSVSISKKQGFEELSASCAPEHTLPIEPFQQTFWHSGNIGLTVVGNYAHIQFTCGEITIEKGWNTDGLAMDGLDKGGPVLLGPGTPVVVTATLKDGKLYVRTNEDTVTDYVFVPGKGLSSSICL